MKKLVSCIGCIVLVAILLALLPVNVKATEEDISGFCGTNLTWTLSQDGTLTISGAGAMDDYSNLNMPPWNSYSEQITSVIIEGSVSSIGNWAFAYCTNLDSISIGGNVTRIGSSAFRNCESLLNVTIPNSVTTIGDYAFWQSSITSISISNSVTTIGNSSFAYCRGLTSVTIPDSVTSIGQDAFICCSELSVLTIPSSVVSIGSRAFSYCSNLWHVLYMGTDSQWNRISVDSTNTELTSAIRHSNATGNEVIDIESKKCTACYIASGVCGEDLIWALDGNGVLTISGSGTMYNYTYSSGTPWKSLTPLIIHVSIEEGVTCIGECAFFGCSSLESITIPKGVTSISSYTFDGCTKLASVTISDTVNSIGNDAFAHCDNLKDVYYGGTSTQWEAIDIAEGNDFLTSGVIHYYGVANGSCGANVIWSLSEDGVLTISGTGAMYDYSSSTNAPWSDMLNSIRQVTIGNGVTSIGNYAFYKCGELDSISLPGSIKSIGQCAFSGCNNLEYITIPNGVTSIGVAAFSNCTSMKNMEIPTGVTSLGYSAFYGCSALEKITLPNGISSIDNNTFSNCSSLTSITIPASVTSIGEHAFYCCSNLESVTILDGAASISRFAFSTCSSLTSITIPDSVTQIEDYAFRDCSSLVTITIPNGVKSIGSFVFSGCSNLTGVTLPKSVTTIGEGVLAGCSNLNEIVIATGNPVYHSVDNCIIQTAKKILVAGCKTTVIPSDGSVTAIGKYAFYGTGLIHLTIPASVSSIGNYAFKSCDAIQTVRFMGNAPVMNVSYEVFGGVNSTVYYPADNITYTDAVKQNYGGTLNWVAYCTDNCIDEDKNHLCDACGDALTKCGEEWVPYGEGYIIVDHENLLALKRSTFAQCMDMDTLFRRVDLCVATAEEMSSGFFSVLFSNNDFLGFLADELGVGVEDLERKAAELMRETGISFEKLQANATVLYVARLASEMNADDVLSFMLQNDGVDIYWYMRDGMGMDSECGQAVTYAALVYGMYNTYVADFGGNEALLERPVSAVQEIRYDANFRDYLCTEEAKQDLEGFLGILRIGNTHTSAEKLLCEGFHSEELVNLIDTQLNSFAHTCTVCETTLSECVAAITPAVNPTCTETGLREGEHCSACGKILVAQSEIPALGHSFVEYLADGKGLKISNCERNCGAIDSKLDENYQSGNIEISPEEDENEDQDKVTIGKELLEEILNAHKEFGLHFIGELLDLLFDCDALDAIKDMIENAPDISIVVQNRTDKPDGHKPNKLRFDISLQIGEALQSNTDFGSGSVTVTIPLDELQLTEKQNVKVYHIKGDTRTEMKSERRGNKVSFKTSHFSEYEVVVDTCTEHNYKNGICTICGAEMTTELFALAGTNLRLGEDLTIFFYVNKSDLSGTDYYAQIRRTYSDGTPDEIVTIPYSAWESYNDSLTRFGYEGLPAAAMADELYITIYKNNGTAVSREKEDSIQMYAMRQIGGANTSAKVNTLLVDMLNYGAAAQEFFKYNTAELANADLTETQQNLYATKTADAVDRREKGTNYIGSTLILASRIEFTFYFTNLSRDMDAEVEYIDIYNKTQKMTIPGSEFITNSGYLGVNIDGLPAGDGKQLISCTVFDKDGNPVADARDSVEGYIARMSEQDKLYTMVMRFVVSSKAYFGK